jgi:ankyrin repeat protein
VDKSGASALSIAAALSHNEALELLLLAGDKEGRVGGNRGGALELLSLAGAHE